MAIVNIRLILFFFFTRFVRAFLHDISIGVYLTIEYFSELVLKL